VRRKNSPRSFALSLLAAAVSAAAVVSLVLPPSRASAVGPVEVIGPPEVRSLVETFLVPTLSRPVRIHVGPCPEEVPVQGCHIPGGRIDTIWLDPANGGLDTETAAHEMGHVFESYMWNLHWEQQMGTAFVPKTFHRIAVVLFGTVGPSTLESTTWTEWFAESYSACARFPTLSETIGGFYGFQMAPAQHALVCPLIDEMGRRYEEASKREEPTDRPVRFRRNDPIG
jgi:hypothetical protein